MAKKTTSRKKVKNRTKISFSFTKSAGFRPLAAFLIFAIIGIGIFIKNSNEVITDNPQKTADAFMEALTTCNFDEGKKYYVVFQLNSEKSESYKKECKPGSSYRFSKVLSEPKAAKNPSDGKNASYLYNVKNFDNYSGGIMVYMVYITEDHKWQVFSITPTSWDKLHQ